MMLEKSFTASPEFLSNEKSQETLFFEMIRGTPENKNEYV